VKIFTAILLFSFCLDAQSQTRHDPLNSREVDLLRENAQKPQKRIDLLIGFAQERMLAIDRLGTATTPGQGNAGKIAALLEELANLIDELDDNLDMYNGHGEDLRRPLRRVLDAEAEFQQQLKALNDNATSIQKQRFATALADASDSLNSSTESARAMLASQQQKKLEQKTTEKQKNNNLVLDLPTLERFRKRCIPSVPRSAAVGRSGFVEEQETQPGKRSNRLG